MQGYQQEPQFAQRVRPSGDLHAGVVNFMNGVYAWMAVGLAITGAVAWGLSQSMEAVQLIYGTPLRWVVLFGPLLMAWFLPSRMQRMERGMALAMFVVFAGLMGAALAYVPLIYTSMSILGVLAATVGMFAATAAFGFVTKKDLTGMGQFLLMAIVGAIIGSFVNAFFIQSAGMSMIISVVVAIAAAGLTAYHTQAIKQIFMMHGGAGNLAIIGALALYVDFINLFLSLLRLFGSSRD